jgi:hypothetical protein
VQFDNAVIAMQSTTSVCGPNSRNLLYVRGEFRSRSAAEKLLALGCMLAVNGSLDFPKDHRLKIDSEHRSCRKSDFANGRKPVQEFLQETAVFNEAFGIAMLAHWLVLIAPSQYAESCRGFLHTQELQMLKLEKQQIH